MHARTWVRPKCELTNCWKSQLKIEYWSKWIHFEIMIGQDLLCEICINVSYLLSICLMSFWRNQFVICFFFVFWRFFQFRLRSSRLGGPRWLREGDESRGNASGKRGKRLDVDVGNGVFLAAWRHGLLRTASRDGFAVSQDWIAHSVCCHVILIILCCC